MTTSIKHPSILWAQRADQVFLTIEDGDLKINELLCEGEKFKIKGEKGGEKYEADLDLYGKLKGAERKKIDTNRRLELVIPKEKAEWWPRLLKASGKVPWIKVDFNKWKDEDEVSDYEDEGITAPMDFSKFMPVNGRGFGMPGGDDGFDDLGMGGEEEMADLENIGDEEGISKEKEEDGISKKGETAGGSGKSAGEVKMAESSKE
ncbi:hypothetical protein ACQ4LE_001815 [Meloidogyne hapla]|uniref:CS domain-containing protein n=1 Tax=Meloidogyne hapla TaxID=6305 RepID=A0A1I8BBY3_MELHA